MRIYLLRHGVAVQGGTAVYPGDDRPLTADGVKKMEKEAPAVLADVEEIDLIVSSPLSRAFETARIVAEAAKYTQPIRKSRYLLPGAAIEDLLGEMPDYRPAESILLVGHNPHLEIFASTLLGAAVPAIEFKKGGACRIDLDSFPVRRPGRLIWHLTPGQLRSIAGR
jgi:phosphohistidine phosphatase